MTRVPGAAPTGFSRFSVDGADVVCRTPVEQAVRAALGRGTLYEYAKAHPRAREMRGRSAVYAAPLPGDAERVVVRHNHHGGLFAKITGDLFRSPGRAPLELAISERLHAAGVPTPTIVAYVVYRAPLALCRSDVVTREVADSFDLSEAIMSDDAAARDQAWSAALRLVAALSESGARHHDLNVKNVLVRRGTAGELTALALDVDRVTFGGFPGALLDANLARLARSARKWRDQRGARVSEAELAAMPERARGFMAAPSRHRLVESVRTP